MKQEELILKLKMLGDVSDIKKNLDSVENWLGKVGRNLDVKQTSKLLEKTRDLANAYKKYTDLVNQPNKSNANLRQLENLSSKITKNYRELGEELKQIDFTQFDIEIDPKVLDSLNAAIKEANKGLEDFNKKQIAKLKETFDTSGIKVGKKGILHDIQEAVNQGSVEKLAAQFDRLTKNKDKFSGDNKALADSLHTILKNMVGPLDQANEESRKARQASEEAVLAKRQEEEAVVANTEAINKENLAKGFSAEQTDKVVQENLRLIESETQAAQAADQFKQRLLYLVSAANAVQIVRRAFNETLQAVKDLDAVMTQMAVVTTKSVGDYWKELPEYTERAYELGAAIKDVYASMTLYYQQGLNTQQATALSNATMRMARIAGLQAAEATDRMTAAMRGFNMALNETNADNVADVYSALAATSAADVDEISTAMTKVASIAHSANMEFETTSALLTAIIETTRESAETAGTALKTVIARFSEVKSLYSTGDLVGHDDEGEEIDVNNISKALRTAGINLNEYLTGAKGLDDIFLELSKKWDSLDNVTQRYIATMAAGSRQQSRFIAMMQNYSRNMELVNTAENAAGASNKQFAKTLESLEAKLNQLNVQWQSFTTTVFNSNVIKGTISVFTQLLKAINTVTGNSGLLKIGAGVGIFKALKVSVDKVIPSLTAYSTQVKNIGAAHATIASLGGRLGLNEKQLEQLREANFLINTQADFKSKLLSLSKEQAAISKLLNHYAELDYDHAIKDVAVRARLIDAGVQEENIEYVLNLAKKQGVSIDEAALAVQIKQNQEISKEEALKKASNVIQKKSLLTKGAEALGEKIINTELAKRLGLQSALLAGSLAIVGALAAIATIIYVIYRNSLPGINKEWEKTVKKVQEATEKVENLENDLKSVQERIDELTEKDRSIGLTLDESKELKDLKNNQISLTAQLNLAHDDALEAQKEVDTKAKEWLDKVDWSKRQQAIVDASTGELIDWQEILPSKEQLSEGWEKVASMSAEEQQKWLGQNSEFLRRSIDESIISYEQAFQAATGNTIQSLVLSLSNITENGALELDKEAVQQKLTEIFGEGLDFDNFWQTFEINPPSFKELNDSIDTITRNIQQFKEGTDLLSDAFGDINEHGYITTDNLKKLKEVVGTSTDKWEEYAKVLSDSNASFEEKHDALNQLYTDYLNNNHLLEGATEANKKLYVEELRRLGVQNAEEVVQDAIIRNQINLLAANNQLYDSEGKLTEKAKALAESYGLEEEALKNLAFQKQFEIAVGNQFIGVSDAEMLAMSEVAKGMGIEANAVANLAKAYRLLNILKNEGMVGIGEIESVVGHNFYMGHGGASTIGQYHGNDAATLQKQGEIFTNVLNSYIDQTVADIQATIAQVNTGVKGPDLVFNPASFSSSSSGGGGGSSQADEWENDYDRLYNLLERIEKEQRILNQLQNDYNDLLREEGDHQELVNNLIEQEASLRRQQEYYANLVAYRGQELANAAARYAGVSQYVRIQDGMVHIDWENIDAIDNSDLFDYVKEAESEYQRILDSFNEAQTKLDTIDDEIVKLRESWRKDIIDFKNRIKEALIKRAQDQIDALENTNKAIDDANKALIDNINQQIADARTQREREEQEQELADQRRRLAYLMQDTTGANQLEILKLQKEIAEGEQDYTDQLIDDKINELERQNDEAAAAREKQIEIMQDQLDWFAANGGFWEQVNQLIGNGDDLLPDKEALFDLFKNFDNFNAMSAEEQEQFEEELLHDIENVSAELGAYGDEIPNPDVETAINEAGNSYLESGSTGGAADSGTSAVTLDDGMIKAVAAATWAKYTRGIDYGWGEGEERWKKYDDLFGPGASDKIQAALNRYVGREESKQGDWSSYSYAALRKRILGYKTGGLADFTGPAWLDGSKAHPELVLSAKDSENFIQLRDVLSHMYANGTGTTQTFGDAYYTFQIQVDQLSSDYDVDQMIDRIQKRIEDSSRYRNVNAVNLMR